MRKLALIAASFSCGVFLVQYIVSEAAEPYLFYIVGASLLFAFLLKGKSRVRFLLAVLGLAVGIGWSSFYTHRFVEPTFALDGKTVNAQVTAIGYPVNTNYGEKIKIRAETEDGTAAKAWLYISSDDLKKTPSIEPGDRLQLTASFRKADTVSGQETDYYFSSGYYLIAYSRGPVSVAAGADASLRHMPVRLAQKMKDMLANLYDPDVAPLMTALLLGDRELLNRDQVFTYDLSTAGVYHIVAVSGMHVAFLVGFVQLVFRRKKLAAVLSVPLVLLFAAVTGFSPSVMRAAVMNLFVTGAVLFDREDDKLTSLSFALALLLILNPLSAKNTGLQLSFGSTLGICLFSDRIYNGLQMKAGGVKLFQTRLIKKPAAAVFSGFASTLGAMALTLPLSAIYFGYVSLSSPITNLLIIPAVSLAFILGALSCAAGAIFLPAGKIVAAAAALPVKYVHLIVRWIARWQFSSLSMLNRLNVYWLFFLYAIVLIVVLFRKERRKILLCASFAAVGLCTVLLLTAYHTNQEKMAVTAVDVGQGQSIVIASGSAVAVVDCGNTADYGAAKSTSEYIRSTGRSGIDILILTHFHEDHAGGACDLMRLFDVQVLAIPEPPGTGDEIYRQIVETAQDEGTEIIYITAPTKVTMNATELMIFPSVADHGENERCVSVLGTWGDYDVLITGDMNAEEEEKLITSYAIPDIELLVVGHHGSKYATSEDFLKAVDPEYAFISVGHNSYGHPAAETIGRLEDNGTEIYRTDMSGNITFTVRKGNG